MSGSSEATCGANWFWALLFLLFLGLKLGGIIAWSWVWVTAPLWLPLAVVIGLMVIMLVGATLMAVIGRSISRRPKYK